MNWLSDLGLDLRLSVRTLRRQPGFTAVAVAILALGLGSSIATFSLVEALVTRVLPYPEPGRLVQLFATQGNQHSLPHAPAALRDYRSQATSLESLAGSIRQDPVLEESGQPAQPVWGLAVTASFFEVLGVPPQLGRTFSVDEEQPGRNGVAIISTRMWRERFGSDPQILGRRLLIDGQTVTVVGVMPPSFNETPRYWGRTDLWRPLALSPALQNDRTYTALDVFARLRPGLSLSAANTELSAVAERLSSPGSHIGLRAISLSDREGRNETGHVAVLTLSLAILLLVIACLNLVGLQVARLVARGHEHAIRIALGARRSRLVRHALAESLLVSIAGGGLGLAVAGWWNEILGPRVLLDGARRVMGVKLASPLDTRVLLFTTALVVATTLVVGTVPVWATAHLGLSRGLHAGGRALTDRVQPGLRQGLVVVQMALALMLLAAGGLFLRGLARFEERDPGWKTDGLLTARVLLPPARYAPREVRALFADRLRARLATMSGVERSALAWLVPVSGFAYQRQVLVEGGPPSTGLGPAVSTNGVSPEYFDTLGMRLRDGRLFTTADEPESVVVINEAAASHLWPGQSSVIGKRLADADRPDRWRMVVGVVSDVGFPAQLREAESPYQSYVPLRQVPMSFTIVLRAQGHLQPEALASQLGRAVADIDPTLPVFEPMSVRAQVARYLSNFSIMGWILFGLAGLGLLLSALGVYGLFSRLVAERIREIGVRMALGAQAEDVLRLVLGKGLRLAMVGVLIGSGGALLVVRLLRSAVTGLPIHDPLSIVVLALTLVVVSLLACWLPARRAATLDPMVALRQE